VKNLIAPIKCCSITILFATLTACGGGSGGSSNTAPIVNDPVTEAPSVIDADGDGIPDADDAFPLDAAESIDTDGDGIGNNADSDDDNDGIADTNDAFPLDTLESIDTDGDGIGNNADNDDDNDGIADTNDAFPLDAAESIDTDGDGIGNNADEDDDNDLVLDTDDIDDNNNGLIEISSLEQLDLIRHHLDGSALGDGTESSTLGCFIDTGCIGYELTQTLDFDINGDGVIDSNDSPFFDYDNDGQNNGWLPIGDNTTPFTAQFNGNGFEIRNLFINRPSADDATSGKNIGLFGVVSTGTLKNIGLGGAVMTITGETSVGSLVGSLTDGSKLSSSYSTGNVNGSNNSIGGLAGNITNSHLNTCYATGAVNGQSNVGGLIGATSNSSTVKSSFSTGAVSGSGNQVGGLIGVIDNSDLSTSYAINSVTANTNIFIGGLVGKLQNSATITTSYWATDISGLSHSFHSNGNRPGVLGVTLEELQCPTAANDTACINTGTLYEGWDAIDDDNDVNTPPIAPWDFGSSTSLPALK